MFAPPAVAGDLVFVGSCSGTFYAMDRRSGERRWSYDVRQDGNQSSFHGAILVERDRVMFGTDRGCDPEGIGHVYAAGVPSGDIAWTYRSPVGVSSNLLRTRSGVCFGTTHGEWGCLDPGKGSVRWKVAVDGRKGCELPMWGDTDGETLFVVAPEGAVLGLRATDGKLLWKRQLGAQATTSPIVSHGLLHVGAGDGRVYSLATKSGRVIRSVSVPGRPVGRPAATRDALLFFVEKDEQAGGLLVALDPARTQVKWSREHERTFASEQPHLWRDVVVTGDCRGNVRAFSVVDGTPRWETNVEGCLRSFGSAGDLLFAGAEEGMVYAIRP